MKRSEINTIVDNAIAFSRSLHMTLPCFAYLDTQAWAKEDKASWAEVFDLELGWDVTDYASGKFSELGACLFTLRNGSVTDKRYPKPYAEKMMIIEDHQALPYHFHHFKMEDILNRGGGTLCINCYWADDKDALDLQRPVEISFDGQKRTYAPGEPIRIPVGSGITLPQRLYHKIWADGKVMAWEVSRTNDDHNDNRFLEDIPRFTSIEEDEEMKWCLCNEYNKIR